MAVHFHTLTIKKVKKLTADCVSVSFDIPAALAPEFLFREGQNITIKKELGGEELRRAYSICTAPHEQELTIAVKKIDGGLFSQFANDQLRKGDVLEVLPPSGKFNSRTDHTTPANFLAIAAGSGITPVISIIKHSLKANDQSRFTLVYGNQRRDSIIFFEELEALKNKYMSRFSLINILSRERTEARINHGRIDAEKLASLQQLLDYRVFNDIFICGPEQMIFTARDYFESIGIPQQHIHFELFNSPVRRNKPADLDISVEKDTGPVSHISIKLDGRSFEFELAYKGQSILDAALEKGADLPFACKGGVCCTCRAKLVEGQVHMDVNYALEKEELAQGFILTCQSHPVTEKVVVDFDSK